jgi:enoyl-CoA hydratase/carnithine racemase
MSEHIHTELSDGVLTIRMNRPDKKNALTRAMYSAITAGLQRADEDPAIRATLIAGTADCFTSGNDVADFVNEPPFEANSPVMRFLAFLPFTKKPLIAAVNGPAIGVGITMLLHCDLVYVGESARLHMPFVSLGLCPEAGSSLIMPAIMGRARAAELLLLAEPFTPQTARDYGIANAVLPDAEVFRHAYEKARHLAALPPNAVRTAKRLLNRAIHAQLAETMQHEADHFKAMLRGPEALEAMTAFLQKRKPDFSKFS